MILYSQMYFTTLFLLIVAIMSLLILSKHFNPCNKKQCGDYNNIFRNAETLLHTCRKSKWLRCTIFLCINC